MPKVRLAVVTDIHHGADYGTKLGASALPLLGRFRDWCVDASPDLVLELGDRINNVSADADTRLTEEVAAAFQGFPREVVHLLGNHDCHALTVEQAEAAFRKSFRDWCADASPDLVLELGDRINNVSADADTRLTEEVATAFQGFPREVVHLLGNHDCHALSVEQAEAAFRKSFHSHSRDQGGFHFVFWNANVEKHPTEGFAATSADIDWLAHDLAATDLPTVICSHMPLDGGSMAGNLYFEKGLSAGLGGYSNSESVRTAIEASGKVVLCIAGHTHWNALAIIDGVAFVTVPALSEAFMSWPAPAAAWASIELGEDIHVRIGGEVPVEYRLPMRRLGAHWVNKYRPYAPKPPARVVPKGR